MGKDKSGWVTNRPSAILLEKNLDSVAPCPPMLPNRQPFSGSRC